MLPLISIIKRKQNKEKKHTTTQGQGKGTLYIEPCKQQTENYFRQP